MRKQLTCPNCGAPIVSDHCEYCGAVFWDFTAIKLGIPTYLKIKSEDKVMFVKAIPKLTDWHVSAEQLHCYADSTILYSVQTTNEVSFNIQFDAVVDDDILYVIKNVEEK